MFGLNWVNYTHQREKWPTEGKHILAHYDDESVVVYQAFCPEIAKYAIENQTFGGSRYSMDRMSWIKTNFLWMMYRSGWATKRNQEHILAVHLTKEGFDEILRQAYTVSRQRSESKSKEGIHVRLQWDPDHDPYGERETRKAIQLGLKGKALQKYLSDWILKIEDITPLVKEQHKYVLANDLENLLTPSESIYRPNDNFICKVIDLND